MTNKQRVIEKFFSTESLADYLVMYDADREMYCTSDGNGFYWKEDAIKYEVAWLNAESDT